MRAKGHANAFRDVYKRAEIAGENGDEVRRLIFASAHLAALLIYIYRRLAGPGNIVNPEPVVEVSADNRAAGPASALSGSLTRVERK